MTLSDPSHSSCHVAASSAPGAAEEGGQGEHSRRRGAKRRWGKSQKSPGADAEPAALAGPGVQTNHFSESSVRGLFLGFTGWPSAVTSSALRAHRGEERSAHVPEVSLSSPSAAWQSGASPGRAPLRPGGVQDASPHPGPPHGNASGQGQGTHRPQTWPLAGAPRLCSVATRGWWLLNWTARAQDVAKATPPGSGTPNQICFLALVHKSVWPERSQERGAKCLRSSVVHESASRVPGPGRTRE